MHAYVRMHDNERGMKAVWDAKEAARNWAATTFALDLESETYDEDRQLAYDTAHFIGHIHVDRPETDIVVWLIDESTFVVRYGKGVASIEWLEAE